MVDGSLESPCRVLVKCIELPFLSLAVEALQGKTCQNSLPSGGGRSLESDEFKLYVFGTDITEVIDVR